MHSENTHLSLDSHAPWTRPHAPGHPAGLGPVPPASNQTVAPPAPRLRGEEERRGPSLERQGRSQDCIAREQQREGMRSGLGKDSASLLWARLP